MNQSYYVISYFFQLHLMLYVCVQTFDVAGTVQIFLETKWCSDPAIQNQH